MKGFFLIQKKSFYFFYSIFRRAAGEPDFQPGKNMYPVPDTFPINHQLSPKFKAYFSNGIKIRRMGGIMVNFNYPDNNDADMFSKMESEINLEFTEIENGYRLDLFDVTTKQVLNSALN